MTDTTGVDVKDKDTDEATEVKARLFRKVPWLLVLTTLRTNHFWKSLSRIGQVMLVTTRLVNTDNIDSGDQTMILAVSTVRNGIALRAAGKQNISGTAHAAAANELARPTLTSSSALGMAAAYADA
jgi:hypothetical protein